MKNKIYFLLSLILFTFSFSSAKVTTLKGTIEDFPKDAEWSLVKIGIDIFEGSQRGSKTEVDATGNFEIKFDLEWQQDIWLAFGGKTYSLIFFPGENLELTFNYQKYFEGEFANDVKIVGTKAKMNKVYLLMMAAHGEKFDQSLHEIKHYEPLAYLSARKKINEEEKMFFEEWVGADYEFDFLKEWTNYYVQYRLPSDLILYESYESMERRRAKVKTEIPEAYYEFLEEVELNKESAKLCSEYMNFLRGDYFHRLFQLAQKTPDFVKRKPNVGVFVNYFTKETSGLSREVVLTKLFLMMMTNPVFKEELEPHFDTYYELVKRESFRKKVLKKYKLIYDSNTVVAVDTFIQIKQNETDNIILESLIKQFPNKVIYIDVWGTFCRSCLNEFKYYKDFLKEFENKDVEFIFLAVYSPKNLWKKVINDNQLKGSHYLLTEKEYYAMEKYVALKGFPQKIIINKQGKIVEAHLIEPVMTQYGEINELLLNKLNNLLGE